MGVTLLAIVSTIAINALPHTGGGYSINASTLCDNFSLPHTGGGYSGEIFDQDGNLKLCPTQVGVTPSFLSLIVGFVSLPHTGGGYS